MESKNFKAHEIIGYLTIDGRKVTYLKTGVKRQLKHQDHLNQNAMHLLNHQLVNFEKYKEFLSRVMGLEDFENN